MRTATQTTGLIYSCGIMLHSPRLKQLVSCNWHRKFGQKKGEPFGSPRIIILKDLALP
jgi:hypothetical protein